jgi:hypothetical protein
MRAPASNASSASASVAGGRSPRRSDPGRRPSPPGRLQVVDPPGCVLLAVVRPDHRQVCRRPSGSRPAASCGADRSLPRGRQHDHRQAGHQPRDPTTAPCSPGTTAGRRRTACFWNAHDPGPLAATCWVALCAALAGFTTYPSSLNTPIRLSPRDSPCDAPTSAAAQDTTSTDRRRHPVSPACG